MTSTLSDPNQLNRKLSASSKVLLTVFTIAGFVCLVSLGIWQLQRMAWKQDLLAKIESRMASLNMKYGDIEKIWNYNKDIEYYRIQVRGEFKHDKELHFYTVDKSTPGWRILTPLKLVNGVYVFVDRGFVPLDRKNADLRKAGQLTYPVEISGFVRRFSEHQGLFVPNNDLSKNEWYWKSLSEMSEFAFPEQLEQIAPFFIESDDMKNPGIWPRGGVTRLNLPNRHLEYALTWFSLAAVLLIVYFLYLKRKKVS